MQPSSSLLHQADVLVLGGERKTPSRRAVSPPNSARAVHRLALVCSFSSSGRVLAAGLLDRLAQACTKIGAPSQPRTIARRRRWCRPGRRRPAGAISGAPAARRDGGPVRLVHHAPRHRLRVERPERGTHLEQLGQVLAAGGRASSIALSSGRAGLRVLGQEELVERRRLPQRCSPPAATCTDSMSCGFIFCRSLWRLGRRLVERASTTRAGRVEAPSPTSAHWTSGNCALVPRALRTTQDRFVGRPLPS